MLWTPADTTTALWLDGADGSTVSLSGSAVTQWNDKSGNSRHVSQSTAASRPAYLAGGFNGLNCLDFDGGDFLSRVSGITTGTYTGAFNVYYVATRDSAVNGCLITERSTALVGTSQWGSDVGLYFISSDGANAASNHRIGLADFNNLSTSGGIVSHFHSAGLRDQLWLNGSSISVIAGTASNISGSAGLRIGTREFGGFSWDGKVCEIIVTTSAQSVALRQQFEGYLAWRWGLQSSLSAGHPWRDTFIGSSSVNIFAAAHSAVRGAV
jgi:hypothetical protein